MEPTLFATGNSAVFSKDRVYRYELRRTWDRELAPVLFVGMNPSTADEDVDDPTIRRCMRFARDWGYGGLLMGNLFAWRATDPKDLPSLHNHDGRPPTSELGDWQGGYRENINDCHLREMADEAGMVIAAWGAIKMPYGWEGRNNDVAAMLHPRLHALKLTKDGHPQHPLYIEASARPMPLRKTAP
jgi:hypothetical protein